MSSKLDKAPIVHGEPTNFFAKKPSIFAKPIAQSHTPPTEQTAAQQIQNMVSTPSQDNTLPAKKRGRPKLENYDRKNAKLSLIFSDAQREHLTTALAKYNEIKKDDVFFTPPSMNEFVVTLIFTNPELKKLLNLQ